MIDRHMKPSPAPLISCLCVTWKKPKMLRRAIDCFLKQTYPNRQLVLIYEDFDLPTADLINGLTPDCRIKPVKISSNPKKTLGELRNISIESADGEYVCQWDDDDWFAPERLTEQMRCICNTGRAASILTHWLIFDATTGKSYVSNARLWEGSILSRKDVLSAYPRESKGEDTVVIDQLYQSAQLALISDMPELYIYTFHGGNTWGTSHFDEIFNASCELSPEYGQQIREILEIYDMIHIDLVL